MNFTYLRLLALMIVCSSGSFTVSAQRTNERITEREIKTEDQFVQAKLYEISGKKDDAIKLMDTIRRSVPDNATVYFELARLYYLKNDWIQTESNLDKAKKLQPQNTVFREFEAEYYLSQNRKDEAILTFENLLVLNPKNDYYYWQFTDILIQSQKYSQALNVLDQMEANLGWSSRIQLKKSDILAMNQKPDEAIRLLNDLTIRFPANTSYLKKITVLLHTNGRDKEAGTYFQKILDINPNDTDAKLGLILLSAKSPNADDKLITLYPLFKNPEIPVDAKIRELMPYVEKQMQGNDSTLNNQLIDICDNLIIVHPNEAKAHAVFADVLKNSGNTTAAIRQYERTLELNKNIYAVWEQLMFCLNTVEDYDKLDIIAGEAMDYFPNQALSYCFAAKSAQERGNIKKTGSLLDDALLISAGNVVIESRVWLIKAEGAMKQKDLTTASDYIQKSLTVSNQLNGDAWELKGDIAKARNIPKEAASYWQKAIETGGNSSRINQKLNSLKKS